MAVVSHDLKNPLNSIQMNAQLLKRLTLTDNKATPLVERVLRSAVTMNNLINDILSIAKMEAGQMDLQKSVHSIDDAINDTVEMLLPMAADKNISLTYDSHDIQCQVEYDYDRMLQVLSNLIGNSIKFTPDDGKIKVNLEKCGPNIVKISISDTGPGIPSDHLPNVFDRFWQANQAKKLGTGLGLSIAKSIVEAHGGEIFAESIVGTGSTFYFTLPL
jgi:two-component system, chemotaxis family, sensor kinase Cph1